MSKEQLTNAYEPTEAEKCYIEQMKAWFKEHEAREKQILINIETSSEIVKQNKIQLEWNRKTISEAKKEFEEWKKSVGIE